LPLPLLFDFVFFFAFAITKCLSSSCAIRKISSPARWCGS
jgi:hypothetical protein